MDLRRRHIQSNAEKEAAVAKAKAEAEAEAEAEAQEQAVALAVKKAEELKACIAEEVELKESNDEKQAEAQEQAEQELLQEVERTKNVKEPDENVSGITTKRHNLRSQKNPPEKYMTEPKIANPSAVRKPKMILKRNTKLSTNKVGKLVSENIPSVPEHLPDLPSGQNAATVPVRCKDKRAARKFATNDPAGPSKQGKHKLTFSLLGPPGVMSQKRGPKKSATGEKTVKPILKVNTYPINVNRNYVASQLYSESKSDSENGTEVTKDFLDAELRQALPLPKVQDTFNIPKQLDIFKSSTLNASATYQKTVKQWMRNLACDVPKFAKNPKEWNRFVNLSSKFFTDRDSIKFLIENEKGSPTRSIANVKIEILSYMINKELDHLSIKEWSELYGPSKKRNHDDSGSLERFPELQSLKLKLSNMKSKLLPPKKNVLTIEHVFDNDLAEELNLLIDTFQSIFKLDVQFLKIKVLSRKELEDQKQVVKEALNRINIVDNLISKGKKKLENLDDKKSDFSDDDDEHDSTGEDICVPFFKCKSEDAGAILNIFQDHLTRNVVQKYPKPGMTSKEFFQQKKKMNIETLRSLNRAILPPPTNPLIFTQKLSQKYNFINDKSLDKFSKKYLGNILPKMILFKDPDMEAKLKAIGIKHLSQSIAREKCGPKKKPQ